MTLDLCCNHLDLFHNYTEKIDPITILMTLDLCCNHLDLFHHCTEK